MRRVVKILAWVIGLLVGIPILLVVLLLVIGNTGPGQRLIAGLVPKLTGGTVTLDGLSGRFPDRLHVQQVALLDTDGAYLTIHDLTVNWSPLQLLHGTFDVDQLAAEQADFARLPKSTSSSSSSTSSSLPVRVKIQALHVGRLEIEPPVAGQAYAFKIDGGLTLDSMEAGQGKLTLARLDGPGSYMLDGTIDADRLNATIRAEEPPHGLIAGLAGLPELGGIDLQASLQGPRDAVATKLSLSAGPLQAHVQGTLDLVHNAADLAVTAQAPAMQPRPDIAWQGISLDATLHGPFDKPDADGHLLIEQLEAAGGGVQRLAATIAGNQGLVHVQARLDGLKLPGAPPDLLSAAPLTIDATAHLDAPGRPVEFDVQHPLLTAKGTAKTSAPMQAHVVLTLPDLAPFAAVAGTDLHGHTALTVDGTMQGGTTLVAVKGEIGLNSGPGPSANLLGQSAKLDLAVGLHGQDITITRFKLDGQDVSASTNGSVAGGKVDLNWTLALADLSALQPNLQGQVQANGHVGGTTQNLTATADVAGEVTAQGVQSGKLTAHLDAEGLPNAPSGRLTAQGTLLDAPMQLAIAVQQQADHAIHVAIDRADWKSLHAEGALTVNPPALVPQGQLSLSMTRLADLAPLLGKPIAGSAKATLDATQDQAKLIVTVENAALPGTASVSRVALDLGIANPMTAPVVDGTLRLDNFSASGVGGSARLEARGPQDALAVKLDATLPDLQGAAAKLSAAATIDVPQQSATVSALQADWRQQTLRLQEPARIGFANGIALDHVRAALGQAQIAVDGRVGSSLDLTASLHDLPADIAAAFAPDYAADGRINVDAHVTGTSARPDGTIKLNATGLRMRSGPGQALPAATLTANAQLNGTSTRIDLTASAGPSRLTLNGTAPLGSSGALDLKAGGRVDLAMIDPLLAANGRRVRGTLTLDAGIGGTVAAPRVNGTARLANGDVQDVVVGIHLTDIAATLQAEGERLRLTRFTAKAGNGTLGGHGTIDLAPPMPVDLTFTAQNASPVANDLLTERMDANLHVAGQVAGELGVSGTIRVRHAEIRIPEKLPSSVAVLQVRNPKAPPRPEPKAAPPPDINLNLTIEAPGQVFVRGHGLDAELAGTIRVQGTAANPQPSGGLHLRHGTFDLAGQTLNFSEGSVDFIGAGVSNPGIHFVANTAANSITATLTVTGTARAPKIALSSSPDLPQDEILAQLLFHRSVSTLSPFEVAQIAAAVASFSGATSGVEPLANLRKSLGLDRLSVGAGENGSPTLEAGRYVAPGVYVGAKQSATGGGTQANVQIDITKGLKLETTAGAGSGSATGAGSSGESASVGLTYQFQY